MMSNDGIKFQIQETVSLRNSQGIEKKYQIINLLGTGQTSVVWKADELDDQLGRVRTVALKVLRPESEAAFREGFENEKSVLLLLSGLGNVPLLYDYSERNAKPAFLSMEWITYPSISAYVTTSSRLRPTLERIAGEVWRIKTDVSLLASDIRNSGMDEGKFQFLSSLAQTLQAVETPFSDAKYWLKSIEERQSGLELEEILLVGEAVCITLDRLHKHQRSYQDFQMQNIHWDRDHRVVKILDWNVVSQSSDPALYQKDIFEFAAFLFYLLTLRRFEPGDMELIGGRKWQETAWVLRIIIQKALNPNPAKRYAAAFDTNDNIHPFTHYSSLGRAFWCARKILGSDPGLILPEITGWIELGAAEDAVAACQILRKHPGFEAFRDQLEDLEKMALQKSNLENLRAARVYLQQAEIRSALDILKKSRESLPENLEVRRWLVVAENLSDLMTDEIRHNNENGALNGVISLEEGRFLASRDLFASLGDRFKVLLWDAEVNLHLTRLMEIRQEITRVADPILWDQLNRNGLKDQLGEFERIQQQINESGYNEKIPYFELILANYPGLAEFTSQFTEFKQRVQELRNQRAVLQRKFEGETFEGALDFIRAKLLALPGNYDVLRFTLDKSLEMMQGNELEKAEKMLTLGLVFITTSPLFREFITLKQVCVEWRLGQEMVNQGNYTDSFGVYRHILPLLPDELKPGCLRQISKCFDQVLLLKDVELARNWLSLERELGANIDLHSNQLLQLENELKRKKEKAIQEREKEIMLQREEFMARMMTLRAKNTEESLLEASRLVDDWLRVESGSNGEEM